MKSFETHKQRVEACEEIITLAGYLVCEGYRLAQWYDEGSRDMPCDLHYYEKRNVVNGESRATPVNEPYYFMYVHSPRGQGGKPVVISAAWTPGVATIIQAKSSEGPIGWDEAMATCDEALRTRLQELQRKVGIITLQPESTALSA